MMPSLTKSVTQSGTESGTQKLAPEAAPAPASMSSLPPGKPSAPVPVTPGLTHLPMLRLLDRSGLSPWLLSLGTFLSMTVIAIATIIAVRVPDPAVYRNSIAFSAVISFFLLFYFSMGRGWHQDVIKFIEFDPSLVKIFDLLNPGRWLVFAELVLAVCLASMDAERSVISAGMPLELALGIWSYYVIQYLLIILCADIVFRQLACMLKVVRQMRIDLLNSEFYSTLANVMVRHIGLYIFGLCIIFLSRLVFTEGSISITDMLLIMMPWYLPGLIIISLYLIPYNHFRHRVRFRKYQELNCIASALAGNQAALEDSLLKDEPRPSKIDLLYYQKRIQGIREWPFTDKIRSLVLFGILPPLTWVIAALIEVTIESLL